MAPLRMISKKLPGTIKAISYPKPPSMAIQMINRRRSIRSYSQPIGYCSTNAAT